LNVHPVEPNLTKDFILKDIFCVVHVNINTVLVPSVTLNYSKIIYVLLADSKRFFSNAKVVTKVQQMVKLLMVCSNAMIVSSLSKHLIPNIVPVVIN
jgi:hypothetical protein